MKKIVYISGSRADFNLMSRTLLELNKHLEVIIIATGMHLSEKWGSTIQEIKKYDFIIKEVDMELKDTNLRSMSESLGIGITRMSGLIEELAPDLIFVEGDKGEALIGAIIGSHLNIPIIHHGGGDISDSIDNKIRNAISMFSDFHLTGNIESYNRLLKMGISKSNVFNVGEPGLDDIIAKNYKPKNKIRKDFNINTRKPLLLLIFYPNTKEFIDIEKQIIQILEVIEELKLPTIALTSNADAGGDIINKFLYEYESKLDFLKVYKHFNKENFLGLMNICSAMIGNSSSGITELPLFRKPYILVGTRQKGRLIAENVIKVGYKKEDIIKAIKKGLYDKQFKIQLDNLTNPYGNGTTYLKITDIILKILDIRS